MVIRLSAKGWLQMQFSRLLRNLALQQLRHWVRRVLNGADKGRPAIDPEAKLKSIRRAVKYSFPTADIEQMLSEIERGHKA